jgi:CheY-like chemotaxis protein
MEPQLREERAAQAILIVDSDESIRTILDLTLRQAGFSVGLASNREEAMKRLADGPDLVIAEASDPDALAFCRLVKQTGDRLPPAVVLISDPGIESKTRGLEAGADDFVVKPIYVQEVVARARALLQRRERERLELSAYAPAAPVDGAEAPASVTEHFISDIGDVPLVDLLRAISAHQKSGVAVITAAGGARGEIFFRQGNVVDAEVGRLSGRDAIYRLFCWSSGRLEIEWKSIRRKDTIEMRPHDLLMEALRRVDEWRRLLAGLPPLDTIFEVDYRVLAERLADIPDEVNRILRLFDGMRTFLQVIDDCGLSDLDAAAAIGKLCHERIVHDIRVPVAEDDLLSTDLEGWLSEATGPFRSPPRLERDLFGASPEAGIGVHGRPTAPLDPLGEGARDALDDDMRVRFTDRLVAEGHVAEPSQEAVLAPSGPGFPTTLQGLGAAAPEPVRTAIELPSVPGEMASSIQAAATQIEDATPIVDLAAPPLAEEDATPIVDATPNMDAASNVDAAPSVDAPPNIDAASNTDATPIVGATSNGDATPLAAGAPSNAPVATLSPTSPVPTSPAGTDVRSASGEIVVRPSNAKIKQSPAAEARLAHLREENARPFVRASQSLTPPGSARALDELPPLVEGPAPEPVRRTTELVDASQLEEELSAADSADELGVVSHRRGILLVAAIAALVVATGALVFRSHRQTDSDETAASDTTSTAPPTSNPAPSPSAPTIVPMPVPGPATPPATTAPPVALAGGAAPADPGGPHPAAAPSSHDDLDERAADPKIARVRAAEAAPLLAACHTSFQEQRMKDAEAACTAARDANMDSAEAHGLLAHALFNRNHRRESLAEAERAVKLNPKWADAYVIIGGVHQDAGEMDDARRAYQRYLELDPRGQFAGDLRAIVDRLGKL